MTSPESTPTRRWRILAPAATLLLAALVVAGPVTARAAEPPPVSCIADNPVDPLGPGFLLDRGKFTTIDHPDAVLETAPYGINNRGQIVGGYDTAGFVIHGFLLDRGRYTTIDVPGALRSSAIKINARGQILGDYEDARGGCHGYLLDKGRFTTIDVPGEPTQALGLNDRGQVVGGTINLAAGRLSGFCWTRVFPRRSTSPAPSPPTRWTSTTAARSRASMPMPSERPMRFCATRTPSTPRSTSRMPH
jgi:hypothetical protein